MLIRMLRRGMMLLLRRRLRLGLLTVRRFLLRLAGLLRLLQAGLRRLARIVGMEFQTHPLTQIEVVICLTDVAAYLFAESFGVRPAYLGAQALEEAEFE